MWFFKDLFWLIYPDLCVACSGMLHAGEIGICTSCRLHLPKTDFHLQKDNDVIKHFWGKVRIESAAAAYHFTKGEKVQNLIHNLKYKGRKDIGVFIGELYGHTLKQTEAFSSIDIIISVPLHKRKLRRRGYNQSDCFAEGLSKSMKIPVGLKAVKRIVNTESQTHKHRYRRFENVNQVFEVTKPEVIQGKHVLLVDDVITTGSTLSACAESLLQFPGTKVSIAAIAHA